MLNKPKNYPRLKTSPSGEISPNLFMTMAPRCLKLAKSIFIQILSPIFKFRQNN